MTDPRDHRRGGRPGTNAGYSVRTIDSQRHRLVNVSGVPAPEIGRARVEKQTSAGRDTVNCVTIEILRTIDHVLGHSVHGSGRDLTDGTYVQHLHPGGCNPRSRRTATFSLPSAEPLAITSLAADIVGEGPGSGDPFRPTRP